MKYAIIVCSNGSYSVKAEGFTNLDSAKVAYHAQCQIMWNASDVITGSVAIFDENMCVVESYREFIRHEAQTE